MCDQKILYGRNTLASTIAVLASFVMITGCATTAKKPPEVSQAAPAVPMTAAEQLAADMNSKADARRRKGDVAYRDPMVHSVNGTRQQIVAQQNQAFYQAPGPVAPADGQTGIAGLVTQPTAVNANRSSIFSAPPPIAVNPDGTLASAQPDGGQTITPMMRSVYSTPPAAMQAAAPQTTAAPVPSVRTSAEMLPPPVIRHATSPAAASPQPIAQVTASGVAATPNPNVHELNGRQAAALAQFIASKNQPQNGKLMVQPVPGASGE